jgi:hypothetical protein
VRQGDDDGDRIVEQELQRLIDEAELDEAGIDHAAEAQHKLPGKYPQQIAGPERQGDRHQPDHLVALDPEGEEIGHRIGEQDDRDRGRQRHQDRFQQQDKIDGALEREGDAHEGGNLVAFAGRLYQVPVVVEREGPVDLEDRLGPEAHDDERDHGHDQHRHHDQERRRHQQIAARPLAAAQPRAPSSVDCRPSRHRAGFGNCHLGLPCFPRRLLDRAGVPVLLRKNRYCAFGAVNFHERWFMALTSRPISAPIQATAASAAEPRIDNNNRERCNE